MAQQRLDHGERHAALMRPLARTVPQGVDRDVTDADCLTGVMPVLPEAAIP
jgi:hypothetical protein